MASRKTKIALALSKYLLSELTDEDNIENHEELSCDVLGMPDVPMVHFIVNHTRRSASNGSGGVKIQDYVAKVVANYSEGVFRSHFRMDRSIVEELMWKINGKITCKLVPLETKVLASIWLLSNQESFRGVADRFGLERGQLQRIFIAFCQAVGSLTKEVIRWPTAAEAEVIASSFESRTGFPRVIGALDGCHISMKPPANTRENYINRKGVPAIQLQAVCDHHMRFLDVYVGWPGSVHDARVYRNSPLCQQIENHQLMQNDQHILGDSAYPLSQDILTPYRDNGHMSQAARKYNTIHSSTRVIVERAFAQLKGKFRRLKHIDMDKLDEIPNVLMCACVLHCLSIQEDDEEYSLDDSLVQGICDQPESTSANVKRDNIAALFT